MPLVSRLRPVMRRTRYGVSCCSRTLRANAASIGLVATTALQNDCHSARFPMTPQVLTIAGHAASVSSAFQPGSFDQLTGSKRTVGADSTVLRGWPTQPANRAHISSAQGLAPFIGAARSSSSLRDTRLVEDEGV